MRLVWDRVGERFYETGVDRGVLYLMEDGAYKNGEAWNGLSAVNENPSGAEANPVYADNIKYLNLMSAEEFGCTIEAYTYPESFEACDGSAELLDGVTIKQQNRKSFGFSYRTLIGNDEEGTDYGYKIHLVYGCLASPSAKDNSTVNESPEAVTMSWEVTTTPVEVKGYKPTSHLVIDSSKIGQAALGAIETILYGSDSEEPRLPLPDEVAEIVKGA